MALTKLPFTLFFVGLFGGHFANAGYNATDICDVAAQKASQEFDVPIEYLAAITRVETGRSIKGTVQPWPWAVNLAGQGFWFTNRTEALEFLANKKETGRLNFDVGCFQINYRWHGENFRTLAEMIDPLENARYAAAYLKSLLAFSPTWLAASGAYHSRTEKYARVYRQKIQHHLDQTPRARIRRQRAFYNHTENGLFASATTPMFRWQKKSALIEGLK